MGKVVSVDLSTLCPFLLPSYGHHLTLYLPHPGTSFLCHSRHPSGLSMASSSSLVTSSDFSLVYPRPSSLLVRPFLIWLSSTWFLLPLIQLYLVPHSGGAGGDGEDNLLLHFGSQFSSLLRPTPFSPVLALTIKYPCHCLGHVHLLSLLPPVSGSHWQALSSRLTLGLSTSHLLTLLLWSTHDPSLALIATFPYWPTPGSLLVLL
ncbi:hypothetical protein DL96DRAFT_817628 [Flagelloscypha sp. PMI_526]|nr:hypothetical protein DL96DRAFT_817628 [Flagelloscypha sp. PMI_526]